MLASLPNQRIPPPKGIRGTVSRIHRLEVFSLASARAMNFTESPLLIPSKMWRKIAILFLIITIVIYFSGPRYRRQAVVYLTPEMTSSVRVGHEKCEIQLPFVRSKMLCDSKRIWQIPDVKICAWLKKIIKFCKKSNLFPFPTGDPSTDRLLRSHRIRCPEPVYKSDKVRFAGLSIRSFFHEYDSLRKGSQMIWISFLLCCFDLNQLRREFSVGRSISLRRACT